ncbi:MAG: MFS transporter [Cyanobacteria bacterium P01_C01_bin.118]
MVNATAQTRRIIATLIASVLMDFMGVGIIFPLLPFYGKTFGASALEIGLLMGLSPLVSIFAPTIWGSLSDRIGRRPALLFNISGTILGFLWLSFANSLSMLFIARMLAGASSASIVIAQSYVLDLTTPENRTKRLVLLEAGAAIGLVLGPALGGLLVGSDPTHPNFRLPGLAAAMASMSTLILAFVVLPVGKRLARNTAALSLKSHSSPQRFCKELFKTLKRPLVTPILILVFMSIFAIMGVEAIFALWCETQFGWGPQQFGYFVILYCLSIAITQVCITGRLARWLGELKLLGLGLSSGVVGFFLIPSVTQVSQLTVVIPFIVFATATTAPIFASLLSHLSGAKQQGKTLGLMHSVTGLGRFFGAIGTGFMFGHLGPNWPYWFSSLLMLTAVMICWLRVTQSQFRAIKHRHRQQKLLNFFDLLDRDRNGILEYKDFQDAGQHLATLRDWRPGTIEYETLQTSFKRLSEVWQEKADLDNNQQIDQTEWLHYLEQQEDNIVADLLLKIIDTDRDGRLVIDELSTFYQSYNIHIGDLEEVFHTLDLNQDGHISQEEFRTLFTQFLHSDDVQSPGNWMFGTHIPRML